MKLILKAVLFVCCFMSCSNGATDQTEPEENIQFEIDETVWYRQDHAHVVAYFEELMGQKPAFTKEQIIGTFTIDQTERFGYPMLMILKNTMPENAPSLDELEKQLNALPVQLEEKSGSLAKYTESLSFGQPILIRDKKIIIIETSGIQAGGAEIVVRQGMFFRGRKLIAVQFSYVRDRDDQYLKDFSKIMDTMQF